MRILKLAPLVLATCSSPPAGHPPALEALEAISQGMVQVVDLTYPLNSENPYWPGETYSGFEFRTLATLEDDGVFSGAICMPEHLGTHLDAPNHFSPGMKSVDQLELRELVRPMVVVDIRAQAAESAVYQLRVEDLTAWESAHGPIPDGAVVFAWTGWGEFWPDFERYQNRDDAGRMRFPGFSPESAEFLIRERSASGLGIDTLSVDYGLSNDFQVHHIVHGSDGYHLENVANLQLVPVQGAWLIAAPIKIEGGSGGAARLWAIF